MKIKYSDLLARQAQDDNMLAQLDGNAASPLTNKKNTTDYMDFLMPGAILLAVLMITLGDDLPDMAKGLLAASMTVGLVYLSLQLLRK
jgi:hypothetical protein